MKTKTHVLYTREGETPDKNRKLHVVLVRIDSNFAYLPVLHVVVFTEKIPTAIKYYPPMYKDKSRRVELLPQGLEDWQAVEIVRTDFLRSLEELQAEPPPTQDNDSIDALF